MASLALMKPALEYRPDVDGLRAVAVLAVLLYHLGVPPVSGGFVGVDIFFVISGYLITGIILSEAAASRFSFADFYARRVRRLLPALIAAIALTFLLAAVLFAPEDLRRASVSTVAALLGASNISFWAESGYFDVTGILKPLLHTWSLAVELQFYLVWPAFLLLLHRFGQAFVLAGIIATIIAGTAASIWILQHDPSAAFYLSPFRMHEFAIGAFVVFAGATRPPSRRWSDVLFVGGIAAILASIVLFDDLTVFPGYAVLLPTVGTALVLYAAASARSAGFLRSWPAVHVGRISYSLYLVHWPLIVFTHYLLNGPLAPLHQFSLIVVSFVLAHLSYRYIEKPFRRPRLDTRKRNASFYQGCAIAACAVLAPALHAGLSGGWVWRFPADLQAINSTDVDAQKLYVWNNFNRLQAPAFTSSKRHVLVVGDSQAADLVNILVAAGFERKNEIVTTAVFYECGMFYMPQGQGDTYWKTENSYTIKNPALIDGCKEQYESLADGTSYSRRRIRDRQLFLERKCSWQNRRSRSRSKRTDQGENRAGRREGIRRKQHSVRKQVGSP